MVNGLDDTHILMQNVVQGRINTGHQSQGATPNVKHEGGIIILWE